MHPPRSFAFTEVHTVPHPLPKERAQVSQVHPNPLPDPVRRHRSYRKLPQLTTSLTLFEGERPGSTPPDPSRPIHPVPKAQLTVSVAVVAVLAANYCTATEKGKVFSEVALLGRFYHD